MASPEMQQLKAMYKTGSLSMDEFLFMSKDLQQTSLAEEEEEASAHDGQSSSHASHDGGAYGNSAGSIAPNSGGRSNPHSNRSNPASAKGRPPVVAALQGLKARGSGQGLGHNRRAAHSMPHRGPGSGPGSRVSSRPPSVGQSNPRLPIA